MSTRNTYSCVRGPSGRLIHMIANSTSSPEEGCPSVLRKVIARHAPPIVPLVSDSPRPEVQQLLRRGAPLIPFFDRYTCVRAPSGRPIHIVANHEISTAQIEHVQGVLYQLLLPLPGLRFGSAAYKDAVANAVAEGDKVIFLQGDLEEDGGCHKRQHLKCCEDFVDGDCGLTACQVVVPGSPAHVLGRKDTTWEEVLHFVQGHGVREAIPELEAMIDESCKQALLSGLYYPLKEHGICTNMEYLAVALEAYYGIHRCADRAPFPFLNTWEYPSFTNVDDQRDVDAAVVDVFESFFPPAPPRTACSCFKQKIAPQSYERPSDILRKMEPTRQTWIQKYATLPDDALERIKALESQSSDGSDRGSDETQE